MKNHIIEWHRANKQKKKKQTKKFFLIYIYIYIYIFTGWCKVRNRKKEKEKRRKIRKTIQKIGKSLWDEKIQETWLGNHEELYITKVFRRKSKNKCSGNNYKKW